MNDTSVVILFGTLRDPELLDIVAGAPCQGTQVTLADHQVCHAGNNDFPMLAPKSGATAQGVRVELSATAVARLDYYEAPYGYIRVPFEDGEVYRPSETRFEPGAPWSLQSWQDRHGAYTREAAREIMGLMGQVPPQDIPGRMGPILALAQARVNAKAMPVPVELRAGLTRDDVTIHRAETPYSNFFAVDELTLSHRQFSGGQSERMLRAVFRMADAVSVLPYDPVTDQVLLIEQFRPGAMMRGDAAPWALEAIAGRMDPGETPEETARREAVEEAHITLGPLERVGGYYPSPGGVSEYMHTFLAICDLSDHQGGIGGVATEDEDIRAFVVPAEKFFDAMASGEVQTGPLLITGLWLQRERTRLRGLG